MGHFQGDSCRRRKVALTGRNVANLEAARNDVKGIGGESDIFVADLHHEEEVDRLVSDVKSAFGDIDILVNNAGVFHLGGKHVAGLLWENTPRGVRRGLWG